MRATAKHTQNSIAGGRCEESRTHVHTAGSRSLLRRSQRCMSRRPQIRPTCAPRSFASPPYTTSSLEASLFLLCLHPLNRSSLGLALARVLAIFPVGESLGRARAAQACSAHDLLSGPFRPPGRSLRHARTVTLRLGLGTTCFPFLIGMHMTGSEAATSASRM
jgi:hypothetical protein